jgi:hypothetical protein
VALVVNTDCVPVSTGMIRAVTDWVVDRVSEFGRRR